MSQNWDHQGIRNEYANILQTHKLRQYFIDATQVTTLALWCKIMQHNSGGSYSTILAANTILNTFKFVKMIHPDFFREDGGSSHHSGLENMIAGTGNQNGKPSTLPYPFPYIVYYQYFHSLLPTPININALHPKHFTKLKKENLQLGSNAYHSGTVWQYCRYTNSQLTGCF